MRFLFLQIILFANFCSFAQSQNPDLWVGTYTSGQSKGIYGFSFDAISLHADSLSVRTSSNPSFLAIAPNSSYLYAVNENGDSVLQGSLEAFRIDPDSGLVLLNRVSTLGKHPCHIQISPSGKWIAVSNYSTGSFTLFQILETGAVSEPLQIVQHFGMGKDPIRQKSSHVHSVQFSKDEKYVFVADLGLDEIVSYPFNSSTGEVNQLNKQVRNMEAGDGPRHMAWHPAKPYLYAISELTGMITQMRAKDGILKIQQRISSLPKKYEGKIGSADIHISPNGKFLYVSNRGDANSITAFKIHSNGKLSWIAEYPTLGIAPRNFSIHPDGNLLFVANQRSNEIVLFSIHSKTGELTDTGKRISVPSPVCLVWR